MVQISMLVLALVAASANAAPVSLNKRIAQVISASTAKWEQACLAAGGAEKCNPVSVTAFTTLLAAAGPCEQQDSADAMINLAKTLGSDATMISLTQIFAQQPRNTPNSLYVPYCQTAPKNSELDGLFQCQFQGASSTTFVGGLAVGAAGTIPFGQTKALSPAGSCKANPGGPIADGTQLTDITSDPGVSGSGSGSSGASSTKKSTATASATATSADVSATDAVTATDSATATDSTDAPDSTSCPDDGSSGSDSSSTADATTATATDATPTATDAATTDVASSTADTTSATSTAAAGDFHLANGQDAQKLNAKFATLTTSSTCTEGEQACVADGFAQCVGGTFVSTPCSGGTICVALPLVNKKGTSITCDTKADALARIAATGATGGLTG